MTKSSRFMSFLAESSVGPKCEECRDPFDVNGRLPRKFPCGHNFCENCLNGMRCYTESCLLNTIKCPTCLMSIPVEVARNAPLNEELCELLQTSNDNITVIHVPDIHSKEGPSNRDLKPEAFEVFIDRPVDSKKCIRCSDCSRKIAVKNLARVGRFCRNCTTPESLSVICLECCVNGHNGHKLMTEQELKVNQVKLLNDLREMRRKIVNCSDCFDRRSRTLKNSGRLICQDITAEKQSLLTHSLATIDEAIRSIEPSSIIFDFTAKAMKEIQLHNISRLNKMMTVLEKNTEVRREPASTKPKGLSRSLSSRHSRVSLNGDESLWLNAISSLCQLLPKSSLTNQLRQHHATISTKDTIEERKVKIVNCAMATIRILERSISLSMIPIFADVLLHCFYQLDQLSRKGFDAGNKMTRNDIWKCVQMSYTDLFKVTAKSFPAYHPERVDILDDLAYLCHLFSDVCDQATVTLCMIEAARARASESDAMTSEDRQRTNDRLKLIDEHLLECRRKQKLLELSCKKNRKGFKNVLKRCFLPKRVHA